MPHKREKANEREKNAEKNRLDLAHCVDSAVFLLRSAKKSRHL
jgi:uncharacterized protein YgiB involved in biofilm formation